MGALAAQNVAGEINAADYSIAAIEYLPTPLERVGSLQAGLVCLPKGKLRWRDLARPDDERLSAALTARLGEAGLSVSARPDALFGDPVPLTRYRLRVVIERVSLRMCIAGLGIGEKRPSGEGLMTVRWETYDRVARAKVDSVVFEEQIALGKRDARGAPGVIGDAILRTADLYARSRTR